MYIYIVSYYVDLHFFASLENAESAELYQNTFRLFYQRLKCNISCPDQCLVFILNSKLVSSFLAWQQTYNVFQTSIPFLDVNKPSRMVKMKWNMCVKWFLCVLGFILLTMFTNPTTASLFLHIYKSPNIPTLPPHAQLTFLTQPYSIYLRFQLSLCIRLNFLNTIVKKYKF